MVENGIKVNKCIFSLLQLTKLITENVDIIVRNGEVE
jgi:hypothetical protein